MAKWFRHKNAMQRDKAILLVRTLVLQQDFGTLSFNTGWKINKYATLQGGIDNLFNKSYAEFVSKGADPSVGASNCSSERARASILVTFTSSILGFFINE